MYNLSGLHITSKKQINYLFRYAVQNHVTLCCGMTSFIMLTDRLCDFNEKGENVNNLHIVHFAQRLGRGRCLWFLVICPSRFEWQFVNTTLSSFKASKLGNDFDISFCSCVHVGFSP